MATEHDAEEKAELDESGAERPALWTEAGIDPVEIALPKGVGYTLRAYRPPAEVTPTDVSTREDEEFPDRPRDTVDEEEEAARAALAAEFGEEEGDDGDRVDTGRADAERRDEEDADEEDAAEEDAADAKGDASGSAADGDPDTGTSSAEPDGKGAEAEGRSEEADLDDEAADDEDADEGPAEIPVFLGHAGRLYLFHTPEGLVDFIRSGADHDLAQLDSWADLAAKVTADDVVPLPEDQYELDLVVKNLRGGYETWDAGLVIRAGEAARDLGYALQLPSVVEALAPGSPLDDLDEVLRATEQGGVTGFFAKRRLRKIGAQAAPLGWRTIIGKISSVVDWRD